jgi:2,7-dihydroxy-5-methyl-1-naphthoate 7-O-methyltransferase
MGTPEQDSMTGQAGAAPATAFNPLVALQRLADPVGPWAIRAAATLRLADFIAEGHTDVSALAKQTGILSGSLLRLMRYLAQRGVFTQIGLDSYTLTPLSEMLREGAPGGMRDFLDLEGASCRLDRVAIELLPALRGDEPMYKSVYGREAWDDLAAHPALARTFDTAMGHKSRLMAPGIAAAYDWKATRHVVDVGGGNGVILAEILRSAPDLKGTLLDRPGTSDAARPVLEAAGVADRCTVRSDDFFAGVPSGGDRYLLVNVLHDWDDAHAEAILRQCARAAMPDGQVIIAEFLVDGGGDQTLVTQWDLLMMLGAHGRERTAEEFADLASKVGLRIASITPTPSGIRLLDCVSAA